MRWRHVLPALVLTGGWPRLLAAALAVRARAAVTIVIALVLVISGVAVSTLPAIAQAVIPPPSLRQGGAPQLAWHHPVARLTAAASGAPSTRAQLHDLHLRHLAHLAHLAHLRYLASLRTAQLDAAVVSKTRTRQASSHASPAVVSYGGSPQAIAAAMLPSYGWSVSGQMSCLVSLWTRESGWNRLAMNPGSGAFGIAQALGHGLPGTGGTYGNQYPSQAANDGDAESQESWGLTYVKDTYGDPCGAWSHELAAGWY